MGRKLEAGWYGAEGAWARHRAESAVFVGESRGVGKHILGDGWIIKRQPMLTVYWAPGIVLNILFPNAV